jgi:hypothetical protein
MKAKITKLVCASVTCVLLLSIAIHSVHALRLQCVRRYAEKIREPFYTLVVNGRIVEHTHTVHFDRYHFSTEGFWDGYDDGRIEIPLLTVLGAMGAEYRNVESGVLLIEYDGEGYFLIPEKQAMYPEGTELTETFATSNQQWDERNLLLIGFEKANGYFREDHGEYIVDLGSLHKLALLWDFTFDFDCERGIVFFYSDASKANRLPGH